MWFWSLPFDGYNDSKIRKDAPRRTERAALSTNDRFGRTGDSVF